VGTPAPRVRRTTTGVLGVRDLEAAAEIIADRAREIAGSYSKTGRLPGSIRVDVSDKIATVSSGAPSAYPNEIKGVRHPVFGTQKQELEALARGLGHGKGWNWVPNDHRPFLSRAADEQAGAAMARYAKKIDRMAKNAGFK
jgi:hypothetical protein